MGTEIIKKESTEIDNVDKEILTPQEQVDFGSSAAKVLKDVVLKTNSKVTINGQEHLKFEAWQTIAKFYGHSVAIEWTKPIMKGEEIYGYEARANVLDKTGRIISSAESACGKDEKTWALRSLFQIKSMAQTRACAKALRNVFSWVVVLAGYEATPAEELEGSNHVIKNVTPQPPTPKAVSSVSPQRPKKPSCMAQGCGKPITDKVYDYSMNSFGVPLCFEHQQEMKRRQGLHTASNDEEEPPEDYIDAQSIDE